MEPNELSLINELSVIPGYTHLFTDKKILSLIFSQFMFCTITSILILYYVLVHLLYMREASWNSAKRTLDPLKDKLRQIEYQRNDIISYLNRTEDKCNFQYALVRRVIDDKAKSEKKAPSEPQPKSNPVSQTELNEVEAFVDEAQEAVPEAQTKFLSE